MVGVGLQRLLSCNPFSVPVSLQDADTPVCLFAAREP